MMRVLQPQLIQGLTERKPRGGSPILSLYLNLDPANPVNRRGGYKTALDGMLKDIESQITDEARMRHFQEDAGWVRRQTEFHIPKGKSLLFFCDVSESFFIEEDLPIRMANQAWFGHTPYVRPLLEARDEYERYGIVLVDREKARFFVVTMGCIDEVSEILDEPPVKHRNAAGSDHMRSQMIFQRRAAKWSEGFLKGVTELLHEVMSRYDLDRILLAGPEEVTAELFRLLPKAIAPRVMDRVRMPVNAKPQEVLDLASPVIEVIERERENLLVDDLITTAHKTRNSSRKAILGMEATLDAINQGRVHRFLYPSGLRLKGYRCPGCDVLLDYAPGEGLCPYCSGPVEEVEDIIWLASERVLESGGRPEEIRGAEGMAALQSVGGVGAILR